MNNIIKFSCESRFSVYALEPVPAKTEVPDWYKNSPIYSNPNHKTALCMEGDELSVNLTYKKCVPFLDSLISGYYMRLSQDVVVNRDKDGSMCFLWQRNPPAVDYHPAAQLSGMKNTEEFQGGKAFKWMNPWYIETPPGYSILVTHPMNRRETRWEIFPAIVDTDSWHGIINFPFFWKDTKFEGTIERGTILAQIIPFRRESWKMTVEREASAADLIAEEEHQCRVENSYRNLNHSKKEFN